LAAASGRGRRRIGGFVGGFWGHLAKTGLVPGVRRAVCGAGRADPPRPSAHGQGFAGKAGVAEAVLIEG